MFRNIHHWKYQIGKNYTPYWPPGLLTAAAPRYSNPDSDNYKDKMIGWMNSYTTESWMNG